MWIIKRHMEACEFGSVEFDSYVLTTKELYKDDHQYKAKFWDLKLAKKVAFVLNQGSK